MSDFKILTTTDQNEERTVPRKVNSLTPSEGAGLSRKRGSIYERSPTLVVIMLSQSAVKRKRNYTENQTTLYYVEALARTTTVPVRKRSPKTF